jgi:hypothetical protein
MTTERVGGVVGRIGTNHLCAKIKTKISGRLEGLLKESSTLKTSVSFYGNMISNGDELSKVVADRELDINEDTLHIFEKAVTVNNASAAADYLPELELENLLPHHLSTFAQRAKLSDFLGSDDPGLSLAILREFGAAKRSYNSPMKLFRESGRINDPKDVYALTEHRFGDLVRSALRTGVVMKINFNVVKRTDDLACAIWINHLAEDGQTFLLFKKAIENTIIYAEINRHILYTLDLGYLIADHFRMKLGTDGLNDAIMDNIVDEKNSNIVNTFLVKFGIIDLRYRS